jgi:hypothetical protein
MANYYTYGTIPSAEETVFGPLSQGYADGGEVAGLFVEGADAPKSSGINTAALDELFANLRKTEQLQKLALEPGLLQQGFTGTSGLTAPPSGAGIFATQTRAEEPAIDFNVTPEMAGALQSVARPAGITAAEREAVTSNPRVQALQQISDKLKADDFAGAFDTALAAERNLGGDFVGNIIDSNKMRELRGPMSAEEITKFYNEMPQKVFEERYVGPGNEFKKDQAIERNIAALGGQAGYVDPMLGLKKEETLLGKLPIKELAALAAAAMGATAIPGLFGAGAGGGGAAGGVGTAGAAGGAGAAGAAGGAGALTGVVPTGLVAGTTAANLALPVFTVTAGGGLTAAQLAAAAAAAGGAGALSGGSAAAPSTPAATTPTQPPLEEVVVTGTRAPVIPPAAIGAGLTGVGAVSVPTTTPVEVTPPEYIEDVVLPEEEALEEVIVKAKRPPVVPPAAVVGGLAGAGALTGGGGFPEGPIEEVVVEGTNRPPAELDIPPVPIPTTTPVDVTPPDYIEDVTVPEEDLEEVIVEGTKPVDGGLNLPPFTIPLKTPIDLPKQPTKINQPGLDDKLKGMLDKYGSFENLMKLLGALGAAGSGSKKPTMPTTGTGTGGMGGALPKYTLTRQQLNPDIDYFTYGTRPEAKFFEQSFQLEKPTQPELPPAKPPGDEPVMAEGGLMGYAKGGSKESRYVDGPGSGREDKIPALLSDGEYVIDAETLALLGDGSTKEGARRMDKFRANIRKHKGRALSRGQISPDAKSPDKYMGGGLA